MKIFVVDSLNNKIQKFDANGNFISTSAKVASPRPKCTGSIFCDECPQPAPISRICGPSMVVTVILEPIPSLLSNMLVSRYVIFYIKSDIKNLHIICI